MEHLVKAKKGSAAYNEWIQKYRQSHPIKNTPKEKVSVVKTDLATGAEKILRDFKNYKEAKNYHDFLRDAHEQEGFDVKISTDDSFTAGNSSFKVRTNKDIF